MGRHPMPRLLHVVSLLLCATPVLAQTPAPTSADSIAPVTPSLCTHMRAHRVMNPGAPVPCERLRLVSFTHIGFDGAPRTGQLVVMDAVAEDVLAIFAALRERRFPVNSARLMDEFDGDDDASTAANNTSALNVRTVGVTGQISLHAFGAAIDLNPLQNPYIVRYPDGRTRIDPPHAGAYVSRREIRPGMSEPVIDLFAAHGFVEWGGRWRGTIDYQHFQVGRGLAYRLAGLSAADARALFARHVQRARAALRR
jgi:D-alanyl-D-alanine carboxypeptidase